MNAAVARTAAAATQAAINMAFSPFIFLRGFLVPVDMHTIAHSARKMCGMSFLTHDL